MQSVSSNNDDETHNTCVRAGRRRRRGRAARRMYRGAYYSTIVPARGRGIRYIRPWSTAMLATSHQHSLLMTTITLVLVHFCVIFGRGLGGASKVTPASQQRWVDLNVRDLGALEGAANWVATTNAIHAGVDAVRRAGGGTLRIPAGQFTAAPFNMTSNMTLYLERDAVLLGTTVFAAHAIIPPLPSYGSGRDHAGGNRRTSLVHGEHLTNVKVLGDWGTINGNGAPWWKARANGDEGSVTRGSLIEFMYCDGVEIARLHLKDSPFWTGVVHLLERLVSLLASP